MLKQIKKYFVLWENSTALQMFEAATKADAMKAARLYRRQWEITDDKPVKALNEAEAAAYEAERNAATTINQGKEEKTMKKTTLQKLAEFANVEIIDATPTASEQQNLFEAAPAIEEAAAIIPEVLPPEQEQPTAQEQPTQPKAAALIPAPLKEQQSAALVDVDADTVTLLKQQAAMVAALPGVKALELVGRWLWAEFADKPSAEIREQLKANKWTWAPKKGKWSYHNPKEARPGKHRFMTLEEIKDKYGHAAII
ncbi:MAG: hypothetical protein ACI4Q7_00985 [Candidatus Avelusimicrobium sp.]